MILKTASYNSTAGTHATLTKEDEALSCSITHEFNVPATATIVLADSDGATSQKYDVGSDAVYVGSGHVKIEEDGACIFNGRILKARHLPRRVMLLCQDWMSQLNEARINYDMREDLGSNLRESQAHADHDSGTYVGPAYTNGANYYFYDDDMNWAADKFNSPNMTAYLVFTSGMMGEISVGTGPYDEVVTGDGAGILSDNGDETDLWADNANVHAVWDDDENWTQDYYFRAYIGHNTPSDFYVHDSVTGAKFTVVHDFKDNSGQDSVCEVQIYDATAAGWVTIDFIAPYNSALGSKFTRTTFMIPDEYMDDCVDSSGIAKVRFNVTRGSGTTYLYIYYIWFFVEASTIGYSSTISITDTESNRLKVGTDLTAAATRIWESIPYCIVQPIKEHIDGIVTSADPLLTLNTSIEATTGISTRNYQERTHQEILNDLAEMDRAVFYIELSDTTPTLIWKQTFNDASPTELTDRSVLEWESGEYDYVPMVNEYHVSGVRIADNQLSVNTSELTPDPGVDSKTKYGTTRSAAIKSTGTVSEYECEELGKALVERDEDVHLYLRAVLAGLSSLRLGDEVNINSVYLGLTNAKYVITHWNYNSDAYRTTIRLHPRQSTGFIKHKMFDENLRHMLDTSKIAQVDTQPNALHTQTWS